MKLYPVYIFVLTFSVVGTAQIIDEPEVLPQNSIIEEFQIFFDNEIKKQGVKGNWIFRLNEITAVHKFDYDKDGHLDSLLEFNAVPVEGGGVVNHYVVLFRNNGNQGVDFKNYLVTDRLKFDKFELGNFYFREFEQEQLGAVRVYKFVDKKFVEVPDKG